MKPIDTDDGLFHDGNPYTGALGTPLPAWWANQIQAELLAVITAGGFAPSGTNNAQLLAALRTLFVEPSDLEGLASQGDLAMVISAGAMSFFARTTAPTGWLKANGAAVSRTTYATLFAAVGTTFGAGDGSTTFNLPDLRGEFLRGWDDGRGVDSGRTLGSSQNHAMQKISGYFGADDKVAGAGGVGAFYTAKGEAIAAGAPDVDTTAQGGDGACFYMGFDSSRQTNVAAETRPRNIALLACIKY